jgi:DnaJ-class molecular chaperone
MTYAELEAARLVLGVGQRATLGAIKARHKALVKQHHPDTGNVSDPEMIRLVNAAYRLLLDYVNAYRFSFAESEFYEQNPEARIRMQFADDPVWGGG